jgi:hypothetical protein
LLLHRSRLRGGQLLATPVCSELANLCPLQATKSVTYNLLLSYLSQQLKARKADNMYKTLLLNPFLLAQ